MWTCDPSAALITALKSGAACWRAAVASIHHVSLYEEKLRGLVDLHTGRVLFLVLHTTLLTAASAAFPVEQIRGPP